MQSGLTDSSVLDYSRIPPRLRDLLRREACLVTSQEQLDAAIAEFDEQHREVQGTRPSFLFLRKSVVREQFSQRLSETRQTLEALQNASQKLASLIPRLHDWISDEIERYLLAESPTFFNGLVKYRFPQDWARLFKRFEFECAQFIDVITQIHKALCALQPEQRLAGQLHIMDMVKVARARGARIDAEIPLLNRLAAHQRAINSLTALVETPVLNCETHSARVSMIDDVNTRELLLRFLNRFQQTSLATTTSLQQQVNISACQSTGDIISFIDATWEILRSYAANEFNPAQMERTLIETERMLEKHEI